MPVGNVTIINLPEELKAEWPEDMEFFTLDVSGLRKFIEPLQQTEVRGLIDIAGWMEEQEITELTAGNYFIPVTVELAGEIDVEKVTMNVIISEREQ